MIVAACRRRHAEKHAPRKERRRHLLQPKPRNAHRAVTTSQNTVSVNMKMQTPQRIHQRSLELVERLPFQVAMTLQDQRRRFAMVRRA
jgi:hypothetical protein